MFKRILVPLDGSGRAERALPVAARLARASGGTIFLVRVLSTATASMPTAPARPLLIQTVGEADRIQAESYLRGVADSEMLAGLSVQTEIPVGLVSPSILTTAAVKHADIIVMCSHGYTRVKNWMMGSVAAKIARYSQVPVLVLRDGGPLPLPKERHTVEDQLRVLVPLDGSDNARAAIGPAAQFAAALSAPGGAVLHLLHVVQSGYEVSVANRTMHAARNTQADTNMAKEYLDATIRQLRDDSTGNGLSDLNLMLTSSVITGEDIARGIINAAESNGDGAFGGYDVVAMTTQGYGGPQRWIGSVTERVLDTSRLPLLIVRPGE